MNLGNYNTCHLFHEIAHVQPRKISFLVLFDFVIRSNAEQWNGKILSNTIPFFSKN